MLLPSSLSALAYLLSPPRPPLLRTTLQITPLEMLLALTLSMSSWALVSHGPWLPSTEAQGEQFIVPVGSLGFSVTVFCIEATCAVLILLARRHPAVGGELGGPKLFKTISSGIFVFFWVFYVMISAMEAYGVIEPGF